MKNMLNRSLRLITAFCSMFVLLQLEAPAWAQSVWSGGSGTDTNWSDALNWSPNGAPGSTATVFFGNLAAGAAPVTNNVVDASFTIASLAYTNSVASPGNYQGTLIAAGQTLTVTNGFTVGNSNAVSFVDNVLISGPGTLVVSNSTFLVEQSANNDGVHQAVLDLSQLSLFKAAVNRFGVGFYAINNANRASGVVYLAQTNVIIVANPGPTNSFIVDYNANSGGSSTANLGSAVYLGQTNLICADGVTVGSAKSAGGAVQSIGALMAFNPNAVNNPTAYFRNADGVSRVSFWEIGDNSQINASNQQASGTNDFSGGIVNALVANMNVGLTSTGNSGGTSGAGVGTLTFGAGLMDVNNLTNGWSKGSGATADIGTGTINVNGTAVLKVNNFLTLAATNGATGGAQAPVGTITVGGGTLNASNIVAGGGNSTINFVGGTLILTNGTASAGTLAKPISNFSISNSVLDLAVSQGIVPIEVSSLSVLAPVTVNFSVLPVITSYPAQFPLLQYASLGGDLTTFVAGSLPTVGGIPYKGYLSNNVVNLSVDLVVTNGFLPVGVDVWTGTNNADWDLASPNWTLFGLATFFVNNANAQFDDSAAGTTSVSLVGNLAPASLVVSNNLKTYTFGGSGDLIGPTSLVKNGTGTLMLTNSGNNSFAGGIFISNGAVQFGNGGAGGNLPAVLSAIVDNGSLILNQSGDITLTNNVIGTGNFVQAGGGVVSLSGSNSYAGQTSVTAGSLMVDGFMGGLASSLLTNSPGAIIGGNGTNFGALSAAGIINPGDLYAVGTFTTANGLIMAAGGSLALDLNSNDSTEGSGINDLLQVTGDLTVNNTTIAVNIQGGLPQLGTSYPVITYSGALHGSFNPVVKSHFAATVDTSTANQVNVVITGTNGAVLEWNSTGSSIWDLGGAANWFNFGTGAADVFDQGDSVLFDDSVVGVQTNVTIPSGVAVYPLAVTNNSGANNYTISGGGTISGPTALMKLGASTLTINTTNSFSGGVTVLGGTLKAGSGTALGINTTSTITNTIASGATIDVNAQNLGAATFVVSGAGVGGNGVIVNSGAAQLDAFQNLVLAGDTTFGGPGNAAGGGNTPGRWDIRGGAPTLTCMNGNAYNLTKVGSNQVTLVGVAVDANLGNIWVQGGVFGVQGSVTSLGNSASNLVLYPGTLLHCAGFNTALTKVITMTNASVDCTGTGANEFDGPVTMQGTNTINLTDPLLFTGAIDGGGGFTKSGASILTLSGTGTYTGNTVISAGTLALSGDGALTGTTNIAIALSAIVDVSARNDQALTLASGQTLGGRGNITGSLTNNPGSFFYVGGSGAIGTNIVSGIATLMGSIYLEVTNNGARYDVLQAANIVLGGTLNVANLDAAHPFAAGQSFQLFSGSCSGAFAAIVPALPGAGLGWDTNSLVSSGTLNIVSTVVPQPRISTVVLSGTNLVFSGTNGALDGTFSVLTSTNLAVPVSLWITNASSQFDDSGNFSVTNGINPNLPQQFFRLKTP